MGSVWPAAASGAGALGKEENFGLHLVVTAVSQQGHKDAKASEVDDLLTELIPHSQAGQGAAELAQDSRVVRERCAEAGGESWSWQGPGTNQGAERSSLVLGEPPLHRLAGAIQHPRGELALARPALPPAGSY